jgi:hypothetical protein
MTTSSIDGRVGGSAGDFLAPRVTVVTRQTIENDNHFNSDHCFHQCHDLYWWALYISFAAHSHRSSSAMANAPSPQYYKQNRLQQLRGFCYAAKAGSISKAAERLLLSQPSVSLQIQALEREFKTTLFERRGPKINLKPRGVGGAERLLAVDVRGQGREALRA